MNAEQALAAHGLNPPRLVGIVRDVVNNASRRVPYMSRTTRDDLESFLLAKALEAASATTLPVQATTTASRATSGTVNLRVTGLLPTEGRRARRQAAQQPQSGLAVCPSRSKRIAGTTVDPDPFEADLLEAADALADRADLVTWSRQVLVTVIVEIAEGTPPKAAALKAGVSQHEMEAMLETLRDELAACGVV